MSPTHDLSRRSALKLAAGAAVVMVATPASRLLAESDDEGFIDVRREPDAVTIVTEDSAVSATRAGAGRWHAPGMNLRTIPKTEALAVTLAAPNTGIKQIRLRWKGTTRAWKSILGDHWERSYGDLQWRSPDPKRMNAWYQLAHTGSVTHAIGVR